MCDVMHNIEHHCMHVVHTVLTLLSTYIASMRSCRVNTMYMYESS